MLAVMPLATSALTVDEVQAKIQALLAQVAELTAQIRKLQGQVGTEQIVSTVTDAIASSGWRHRVCALLERNLSVGMTGDDVRSLQEFLQEEGYLSAQATGYFGQLTQDALMRWQASEGVVSSGSVQTTGWGLLGPRTRERIKLWCGLPGGRDGWVNTERFSATPMQGAAPLTVTFSTWLGGFRGDRNTTTFSIDFGDGSSERAADCYAPADACISPGQNTHTYTSNGIYTATLNKTTDPCRGNPMCMAPVSLEVVGKVKIYVGTIPACTKEYKPVCGSKPIVCITTPCNPVPTTYSNRCMMEADGATFLYEGQCRTTTTDPGSDPQCRQWFDGCNTCSRSAPGGIAACTLRFCPVNTAAYCVAYFGDSSTNKPPTISGFSGPTTLKVNETGTWTVKASDPEGQVLSYSVSWGDEAQTAQGLMTALPVFTQTATFTHAYSSPGTYMVTVIARDVAGKEARVSITVQVSRDTTACTLQYDPVCGRPPGCKSCAEMGYTDVCPAICALKTPQTYSNRCFLDAAGASVIHDGACYSNEQ